jgi:hypothetical protein
MEGHALTRSPKVLPASVYDRIATSAVVHGGVGSDNWIDDRGCPLCIHGHAGATSGDQAQCLLAVNLWTYHNDLVVRAWKVANGYGAYQEGPRMPWADYVRAMNLVRGPEEAIAA